MGVNGAGRSGRSSTSCGYSPSCSPSSYVAPELLNPNPNPSNFKILRSVPCGEFLVVEIEYPDCTNYEGKKILVYHGVTQQELEALKKIDPHFCDGDHVAPIARFEPTQRGLAWALMFATSIDPIPKPKAKGKKNAKA